MADGFFFVYLVTISSPAYANIVLKGIFPKESPPVYWRLPGRFRKEAL